MSRIKKRVSKKNKHAWRKYSDVKDVEEFLEDQRLEERIGKAELKQNEELFQIDREGKVDLLLVSRKETRREKVSKPLKSLAPLENTSKVLDPISKRNHVRPRNKNEKIISKHSSSIEKSSVMRNRKSLRKDKVLNFCNNLWLADNAEQPKMPGLSNEWVEKDLVLYHSFNTGKRIVPRPKTAELKSKKTKPTELPHPGMSYNPSLKDHQDLMNQVLEKEGKLIKEEQHLKRVTTDMYSKIDSIERDILKFPEDPSEAEEGEPELDQQKNTNNSLSINPPVQNKKKPIKKRRNERVQRQLKQQKKELKLEKKKITDIHRLKVIKSEVEKEEEELKKIKQRRKIAATEKKKSTQRLAKLKFKEPDIPINSVTDLCGNLRNLKTESTILEDKFKSLQKRNILPPSVDIGIRKRSKIKRFVRSSHKQLA